MVMFENCVPDTHSSSEYGYMSLIDLENCLFDAIHWRDIQVLLNKRNASLRGILPCTLMALETFVNLSRALSSPSNGIPTLQGDCHPSQCTRA